LDKYYQGYATQNGELLGHVNVGHTMEGYNFEDAIVISESGS
jgi:DNA-directed RNA polymerase beta subunit